MYVGCVIKFLFRVDNVMVGCFWLKYLGCMYFLIVKIICCRNIFLKWNKRNNDNEK